MAMRRRGPRFNKYEHMEMASTEEELAEGLRTRKCSRAQKWDLQQSEALRELVQCHGRKWRRLAQLPQMRGWSHVALKMRWREMEKAEVAAYVSGLKTTHVASAGWRQLALRPPTCNATAELGGSRRGKGTWPRARKQMGKLALVKPLRDKSYRWRQARWTTGIKQQIMRTRAPKVWERVMIALWGLRGGSPRGLCAVSLGAEREARQRSGGRVGASVQGQQSLRTLLAAPSQRIWLHGAAMPNGGRFAYPEEYAWWMGIHQHDPGWSAARRILSSEALITAVALAVDARVADAAVRNAMEMLQEVGWAAVEGVAHKVISLYAGALDTLQVAVRRATGCTRCAAAAELDPERAKCLQVGFQIADDNIYATAMELVDGHHGETDWLIVTPPCKWLSAAPKLRRALAVKRARETRRRTRQDIATVIAAVTKFRPKVVVMEQTSGLRTHHWLLYEEVQEALQDLPYVWRHSMARAERLGAPHRRARLIWVGVRKLHA